MSTSPIAGSASEVASLTSLQKRIGPIAPSTRRRSQVDFSSLKPGTLRSFQDRILGNSAGDSSRESSELSLPLHEPVTVAVYGQDPIQTANAVRLLSLTLSDHRDLMVAVADVKAGRGNLATFFPQSRQTRYTIESLYAAICASEEAGSPYLTISQLKPYVTVMKNLMLVVGLESGSFGAALRPDQLDRIFANLEVVSEVIIAHAGSEVNPTLAEVLMRSQQLVVVTDLSEPSIGATFDTLRSIHLGLKSQAESPDAVHLRGLLLSAKIVVNYVNKDSRHDRHRIMSYLESLMKKEFGNGVRIFGASQDKHVTDIPVELKNLPHAAYDWKRIAGAIIRTASESQMPAVRTDEDKAPIFQEASRSGSSSAGIIGTALLGVSLTMSAFAPSAAASTDSAGVVIPSDDENGDKSAGMVEPPAGSDIAPAEKAPKKEKEPAAEKTQKAEVAKQASQPERVAEPEITQEPTEVPPLPVEPDEPTEAEERTQSVPSAPVELDPPVAPEVPETPEVPEATVSTTAPVAEEPTPDAPLAVNAPPAEVQVTAPSARAVDRTVASAPASAQTAPSAPVTGERSPLLEDSDVTEIPSMAPAAAPVPTPVTNQAFGQTYTVVSGDSLWHIAGHVLRDATGHEVSDAAIAAYVEMIYEVPRNRSIIGENPDVIHSGQVLHLPDHA